MEAPQVVPEIARGLAPPLAPGAFLLAVDGRPAAWCDPHGAALDPIEDGRKADAETLHGDENRAAG